MSAGTIARGRSSWNVPIVSSGGIRISRIMSMYDGGAWRNRCLRRYFLSSIVYLASKRRHYGPERRHTARVYCSGRLARSRTRRVRAYFTVPGERSRFRGERNKEGAQMVPPSFRKIPRRDTASDDPRRRRVCEFDRSTDEPDRRISRISRISWLNGPLNL